VNVNNRFLDAIKLSRAASHVKWLEADETNVLTTISVLVLGELKSSSPREFSHMKASNHT
jgi:hypothetical protein